MDQTTEIRDKIDIISFINEFVPLKKAGRNFKANCPFHSEKTPSFVVSPERQMWHCFGCQKGGDCFTFLMEYERLEFPEALRMLAKRTGVTLTGRGYDSQTSSKKDSIYTMNHLAAEYYHYVLMKHSVGSSGKAYLTKRGVSEKVMNSFLLGCAPNARTGLVSYLTKKKGYTTEDVLEAGLATTVGRDTVDFFRGRIMFPLFDHRDNIVGFAGRTLDTTGMIKAKYINTRETLAYHKGEMFFGLNMTKDAIRKANQVVLVEGEFDVISCFQTGVGNVVGVKGTALTEKQVQLLSRYAQKVTVCFDGDRAGQEAIKRSLPILEKYNLQTTVIVIPGGKDPDDAIREDAAAFKQAVKHDLGIYDFLLTSSLTNSDTKTAAGKGKISSELLPIFAVIGNEIIKEHYLKKLSAALDTTYESLQKEITRLTKKEQAVIVPPQKTEKQSREEMLEEYLLSLILQYESPKVAMERAWGILSDALVTDRAHQKILSQLAEYCLTQPEFVPKTFVRDLPAELLPSVDKALLFPLTPFSASVKHLQEVEKTAHQLREVYLKDRIKRISLQLKEQSGDKEVSELREQFSRLVSLLEK
jgi:DNA primase